METDQKTGAGCLATIHAESLLGASFAGQKKYAEAEPLLLEGYHGMLARKNRIGVPDRYHLQLAHQWLVQLYKDWGKPQKATRDGERTRKIRGHEFRGQTGTATLN